jgi:hypothetical protein
MLTHLIFGTIEVIRVRHAGVDLALEVRRDAVRPGAPIRVELSGPVAARLGADRDDPTRWALEHAGDRLDFRFSYPGPGARVLMELDGDDGWRFTFPDRLPPLRSRIGRP